MIPSSDVLSACGCGRGWECRFCVVCSTAPGSRFPCRRSRVLLFRFGPAVHIVLFRSSSAMFQLSKTTGTGREKGIAFPYLCDDWQHTIGQDDLFCRIYHEHVTQARLRTVCPRRSRCQPCNCCRINLLREGATTWQALHGSDTNRPRRASSACRKPVSPPSHGRRVGAVYKGADVFPVPGPFLEARFFPPHARRLCRRLRWLEGGGLCVVTFC